MSYGRIRRFRSVEQMRSKLEHGIKETQKEIDEYSVIIGDKLRAEPHSDDPEFAELKEKLKEPTTDSKDKKQQKKKPAKTKNQKTHWLDMEALSVYDEIGTKAEIEIYFRALDELKTKMENMKKSKESIDNLLSKGLKKDLGCLVLTKNNLPHELVFLKIDALKDRFNYKAVIHTNSESIPYQMIQ